MNISEKQNTRAGAIFPQHSFWSEDFGPYTPTPSLHHDVKADIVIIGAGFTGLSTAINLKQMDASTKVVVIEQEAVGYGASGRNSGWVWPNLSTYQDVLAKHGLGVLRETYAYAKRAYTYVGELVQDHKLDSDYRKTGILRPSVSPEYERERHAYGEFCEKLGRADQIHEMDEATVQAEVKSPLFYKAFWDKELALIQPVKHARALARLAVSLGVELYEQTPAMSVVEEAREVVVHTPAGRIRTDRLVLATNAYTHLLRGSHQSTLQRHQRPAFVYNMITRPLTGAEWESVGWQRRNAIYSFGPASHFGNPTSDGRIHWCSDRFVSIPHGNDMAQEYSPSFNPTLKAQTPLFFPGLSDVELTHHWGGPVAITMDRIFHLGHVGKSERILISAGCNGNGVSLTHLNGKILAELLTGKKSELSDLWFVNQKPGLWPSSFFSVSAMRALTTYGNWHAKRRAIKAGLGALVTESQEGLAK